MDDIEKTTKDNDGIINLPNNKNFQDIMENVQKILEDPEKQQLLSIFKKIMDTTVNENNDPRINLLNALKPFLKPKRQKTIDSFKQYYTYLNVLKTQEEIKGLNKTEEGESGLQHL